MNQQPNQCSFYPDDHIRREERGADLWIAPREAAVGLFRDRARDPGKCWMFAPSKHHI